MAMDANPFVSNSRMEAEYVEIMLVRMDLVMTWLMLRISSCWWSWQIMFEGYGVVVGWRLSKGIVWFLYLWRIWVRWQNI